MSENSLPDNLLLASANTDSRHIKLRSVIAALFAQHDEAMLDIIIKKLQWTELHSGQILFREGDIGDSLYILISGRMKAVIHQSTPEEKVVGEISKGESVGEMALITGEARTATVSAIRDCTLVKLSKTDFESLVKQSPELVMNISRLIINRLTYVMHHAKAPAKTFNIALIPTTDTFDISIFTQQLLLSFNKIEKTFHLNREILEKNVSKEAINDDFHLNSWLTDLEIEQNCIIYEGDANDPEWTNRCLRQADKIIFIKDIRSGAELSAIEEEVFSKSAANYAQTQELVLLYPQDTRQPDISHALLVNRPVNRHYNIRNNDSRHMDRLARMITDKGIGLVLSGGGARGFAHIGIYKALVENGTPIDMICGTSIGGIIAAGMAMEWDLDEFLKSSRSAFVDDKPLQDYTIPVVSLIKGHKLQKVNKKYFQDYHIEDLWLNYFCVSSNYSTSEAVVHEKGLIWKAITATASIPGVLPPIVYGDHLLIDGGVFNNFPVDLMHAKYGGKLIGIDLKVDKEYKLDYTQIPGGWYMLFSRFIPFMKKYRTPGIASIMMKSTLLSSTYHQKSVMNDIDVYMHPPVGRFSLLKMEQFDEVVQTGYDYAKEFLKTADIERLYKY